MSTKGKKDLTQDLVDFLFTEDERKKGADGKALPSNETKTELAVSELPTHPSIKMESISKTSKDTPTARGKAIFDEVSHLAGGVEAVRVAQARIKQLELERDQLRDESEKLLSASEAFQRRIAEIKAHVENVERAGRERIEILEEEKAVITSRLSARETELADLKKQFEELQTRFQNDLRKIRVRERELEHRNEIMKAEAQAVSLSKDEIILELKRQLEQLRFEIDNFKLKSADMNSRMQEFYDRNHRTVKALRIALNVLEGSENDPLVKKASGQ